MVEQREKKEKVKVRQPKRVYNEAVLQEPALKKQKGRKEE